MYLRCDHLHSIIMPLVEQFAACMSEMRNNGVGELTLEQAEAEFAEIQRQVKRLKSADSLLSLVLHLSCMRSIPEYSVVRARSESLRKDVMRIMRTDYVDNNFPAWQRLLTNINSLKF